MTVQYTVDPSFSGQAPYSYAVEAYEDNTLTEPIYTIPSSTFYAVDNSNVRQNVRPSFLYRVKLVTNDNMVYYSQFVGWRPSDHINRHKYLIASEITRREHVRFNYAGLYAWLLKRKTYSAAAVGEVDVVTGEPIVDSSSGSYGVGMAGGYYTPTVCRFSVESRVIKENYNPEGNGVLHIEQLAIRSVGFPYIDQHDIIVTADGKRYTVTDPGNKFFPGTTLILLQMSQLQLVPPTDTIYSINVPALPSECE